MALLSVAHGVHGQRYGMSSWVNVAPLLALVVACSAAPPLSATTKPDGSSADAPASSSPSGDSRPREEGPLGVVAIDLQQVFFDTAGKRNPKTDVSARMARSAHLFELAGSRHVPLFVTFEARKTGDHALPPSLTTALPAQALELVKTTFAATGQPQLLPAIETSGARRLLVLGAETDVCIMQTMLGLRRAGYEVIAVVDALLTEEVNTAPAFRRMRQAGIVELGFQEAEDLLTTGGSSPAPSTSALPVIVRPLETGLLLHDLADLGDADTNASAKTVRLRELLLLSEWFRLPVFAADPAASLAALPADLRGVLTRPILALSSRPSTVTQLAVAGGHRGIAEAVLDLVGKVDVFVVEDALLGGGATDLEPLYVAGAVPTTYKALYYELIQSVDDAGWPSQQWVRDGSRFFDMTIAPEELPPLTP